MGWTALNVYMQLVPGRARVFVMPVKVFLSFLADAFPFVIAPVLLRETFEILSVTSNLCQSPHCAGFISLHQNCLL
jgi:hypothetical protein